MLTITDWCSNIGSNMYDPLLDEDDQLKNMLGDNQLFVRHLYGRANEIKATIVYDHQGYFGVAVVSKRDTGSKRFGRVLAFNRYIKAANNINHMNTQRHNYRLKNSTKSKRFLQAPLYGYDLELLKSIFEKDERKRLKRTTEQKVENTGSVLTRPKYGSISKLYDRYMEAINLVNKLKAELAESNKAIKSKLA